MKCGPTSDRTEGVAVGAVQCPCCFEPLEVRDVTPCDLCGGWPDSVASFKLATAYTEYRIPSGHTIVLCWACELEEFMVPGGWGYRLAPTESRPINSLQRVRSVESPRIGRDKFCSTCNLRLSIAVILADKLKHAEPGAKSEGGGLPSNNLE